MCFFFSLCFINLISFIYNQLQSCTIDDFDSFITPCDSYSHTRLITYYKKTQCEILNQTLLPLANTPTFSIKCDTDCPSGQYLEYNLNKKAFECKKCPMNTYSIGKNLDLDIWSDEIVKLFDISCVTYNEDIIDDIKECSEVTVTDDKKFLIVSSKENEEVNIVFNFDAIDKGELSLFYNKTEYINDKTNIDGIFKMYIDYDLIVNDISHQDNISNQFNNVIHSYEKGKHRLSLKFQSKSSNKHKLILSALSMSNVFDIPLKCKKCKTQSPFEGSAYCKGCKYNEILSENKCEQCNEGEISIDNKCINVPECNEFDYHIIDVNEQCDSSKRTIYYITERNYPLYCYDSNESEKHNNIKIDTDTRCIEQIKKEEINKCDIFFSSEYKVNKYKLKNNFHQSEKIFDNNLNNKETKMMLSNGNYIYVPKNANKGEKYILRKKINIISFKGNVQFNAIIDIKSSEIITLKISNQITQLTKSDKYIIDLDKGDYIFELIYEKVSAGKIDNRIPLKIDSFEIKGGSVSNRRYNSKDEYSCEKCPEGYKVDNSGYSCEKDSGGASSPNATYDNNEMILKPKGQCPLYTYLSNKTVSLENQNISYDISFCTLYHQIQSNNTHFRINIASYDYYINSLTNIGIKYKASSNLLGPIIINNQQSSLEVYLSIFHPALFAFDDFTLSLGYAFSIEHNYQYNTNSFTTLGRQLSNAYLVDIESNTGIIMKYDQGDSCESDMSIKRSVYVFLKCDKTIKGFSSPNITSYSDNKCDLFIEISSPLFCKTCIRSEVKYTYGKCIFKQKEKIYQETNNCLFDHLNDTYQAKSIYSISFDDAMLNENSTVYQLMMKGKPKSKKKKKKNKKVKNDRFIENMIEYENCDYVDYIENHFYIVTYIVVTFYFVSVLFMLIYCVKYCYVKNKHDKNGMNKVKISSEH